MDLSTIQARKTLVGKWAVKYGLDVAIVCAVCEQESGWNPWAMRYEPAFYDRYIAPMTGLTNTEMVARSTSYGLMQVMGQVAREFGYRNQFLSEMCDPDTGVAIGCQKLAKCFSTHSDPESALLAYNGGGNPDYGRQVLARVGNYSAP